MGGALWPSLLWLLLVSQPIVHTRAEAGVTELNGILGESVTFPVGVPAEQFKTAAWIVNTTLHIATVGAGNPPTVLVSDSSYEGRLRVPAQNYSLQIAGLRAEDTGTYRAQMHTATGIVYRYFTLRVYKRVPEPTIICAPAPCENGTCHHSLACTIRDGGKNMTYSWTGPAGGTVLAMGPILHIPVGAGDAHQAITCTAQNPASHSSAMVSVMHLCAASPTAQATSLSYCRAKGLALLLVLGALGTGILAVHVLGSQQRQG